MDAPAVPLPAMLRLGWECPRCGAGCSPYVDVCPNCAPMTVPVSPPVVAVPATD